MPILDDRIQILRESGVISGDTAEQILRLRSLFLEEYGIELTEENASSYITHMCFALERIAKKEGVAPLDEAIVEEMADEDDYESACVIADGVFRQFSCLTKAERDYVILHVITMLKRIREDYDRRILGGES